jgi:hypothetical protein
MEKIWKLVQPGVHVPVQTGFVFCRSLWISSTRQCHRRPDRAPASPRVANASTPSACARAGAGRRPQDGEEHERGQGSKHALPSDPDACVDRE